MKDKETEMVLQNRKSCQALENAMAIHEYKLPSTEKKNEGKIQVMAETIIDP